MASVIDGKAIAEDRRRRVRGAVERLKAEHGRLVGYVRRNFLVPVPRVDTWDELNRHLREGCSD